MAELEDLEDDSSDESCSEAGTDHDAGADAENQDNESRFLQNQPARAMDKPSRPDSLKQGLHKYDFCLDDPDPYKCNDVLGLAQPLYMR